jgi:hypothetical protein
VIFARLASDCTLILLSGRLREGINKEQSIMNRKIISPLVCAGAVFAIAFLGTYASAQSHVYAFDIPVASQTTTNSCAAGEPVILNGTVHLEDIFNTDADGVNHFSITVANDLNGVGQASGMGYRAADSTVYTVNTSDSSAELYPDLKSDLIPQSSGTPLTLLQSLQISMDTNGGLTGQVNQNASQCAN